MATIRFVLLFALVIVRRIALAEENGEKVCPEKFTYQEGMTCFAAQLDTLQYQEAETACENLAKGARLASVPTITIVDQLSQVLREFINHKLKASNFWIGMRMEVPKPWEEQPEHPNWEFDIDGSKVSQAEYPFWNPVPNDERFKCAIVNGSNDFFVQSVDCSQHRFPLICQKKEQPCVNNHHAYLGYGGSNACLAVVSESIEYKYATRACTNAGSLVAIKDLPMKASVEQAVRNSFIGGGMFVNLVKDETGVWRYRNGDQPKPENWAEGEPREPYTCAGLAVQLDGTLKLRSINCEFPASYLCSIHLGG